MSIKGAKTMKRDKVPVDVKQSIVDNIVWEIERLIDEAGELRVNMNRLQAVLR